MAGFRFVLAVVACAVPMAGQSQSNALRIVAAFERIGSQDLWPGFTPTTVPVEFFDGKATYIFGHPSPPEGFRRVGGERVGGERIGGENDLFVYNGQHETVRANTGTIVNGTPTATADVSGNKSSADAIAALLIHEAFHVFQTKAYPNWGGDEGALFTYPVDNAEALALRRLESVLLVRAMDSRTQEAVACRGAAAMALRTKRYAILPQSASDFERGVELREGLAQYVESKSIGIPPALTVADFPPENAQVRQRAYAAGQALATLLDRLDESGAWRKELSTGPSPSLDQLLTKRVRAVAIDADCNVSADETAAANHQARRDIEGLAAMRDRRRNEFLAAAGTRLELIADNEPLWPNAFDPWNVLVLGGNDVLHTRWLKLGNGSGQVEILGHSALTRAVGPHPLFNGIRQVILTGLSFPKIVETGGKVTIETNGVKCEFFGTVEHQGDIIRVHLLQPRP